MIRDLLQLLHNWRTGKRCDSALRVDWSTLKAPVATCTRVAGHPLNHRGVDMFDVEREWR